MSADTRKLIFVIFYTAVLATLVILGKIDSAVAIPAITAMGGYVVGNGYNSLQGRTSTPIISPKDTSNVAEAKGEKDE